MYVDLILGIVVWLIDFNVMSTRLGLFHAKNLVNHVHYKFINFCVVVSQDNLFVYCLIEYE